MSKEEEKEKEKEKDKNKEKDTKIIKKNENKDSKNQKTPEKAEKIEYSKMIGNYILFDQIGMGTFSKVTRAVHILTEQVVAVKILEKEKIEDDIDVERIVREIEILKSINHPNIAQMFESYSTVHNIYLMMEYVEGGDLFDYINSNVYLSEQKACYIFRQLIGVIEYLNEMAISHRDIKPENILLDKDKKNIKVIDFGLSNYCEGKTLLHSSCGSPCYASPEMLSGKPYQGITTDLWSSGIVLYSMLVGSLPFDEQEIQNLYEQIKIGKFYLPSTLSLEAIDFMKKLLVVDPQKRMGLNEIKNHPWFKMENNPIYKGINIDVEEFPCDMKVASYVIKHYFKDEKDINIDSLVDMVKTNACNKYTATYYLTKIYILCVEDKYKTKDNNKKNNNINNEKKKIKNSANSLKNSKEEKINDEKEKIQTKNEKKNIDIDIKKSANKNKNNLYENNDLKIRSKTEENEAKKNSDKKNSTKEKKNYPSLIINTNNINGLEEQNNIILTENDCYNNNNKVKIKEIKKKSEQCPSNNKKQKNVNKIEITNLNLKNITNDIKKTYKSKQKVNQEKKISNNNLKSTVIKRKNPSAINNIKSLTERINDYGKKEISLSKINNLMEKNRKINKKKSLPSSNNFNFYVINNIIHKDKDKQELSNVIFNIKLNQHKKNKSSSLISKKIKNIPLSKTQERLNIEIQNNNKIKIINDELKVTTKINENQKDCNSNINKKFSNANVIISKNIKKRRNINTNKNSYYYSNNQNLSNNNFNYINTNHISNIDKYSIKKIINVINTYSNCDKKKSKMNNLTLCKNIINYNENNYTNISHNIKNKPGNSFLVNYIKQKNLLNYLTNSTTNQNHLKRQSHQRNLSNTLRNHLTNFKTDISNKSNTASISRKKENDRKKSLNNNPYFPNDRKVINNKFLNKGKIADFGNNNKSYHKNKNKVI
jgi:5'-AMP-activated protein kinase catalytic alpha subunit